MPKFDDIGSLCLDEEDFFAMEGGFKSPAFKKMKKENKPYVSQFCKQNRLRLVETGATMENGIFEPTYTFSDNLGPYTIEGIKKSLK